jgi:hypothetical protein
LIGFGISAAQTRHFGFGDDSFAIFFEGELAHILVAFDYAASDIISDTP